MRRTVADWLAWQETLSPTEIDLGLERVRQVYDRLALAPPPRPVVTIGGTNGKGSTAVLVERFLRRHWRTGLYTSPHLVCYNERISVNGEPVSDTLLIEAFEAVEAARDGIALTYFEFGTLAALVVFQRAACETWILEVGLGGRLDAVNIVDPDVAIVTSVGYDHQDWLGADLESIAREKAGIFRRDVPAIFGSVDMPEAIRSCAEAVGAPLVSPGDGFEAIREKDRVQWRGTTAEVGFRWEPAHPDSQLENVATALAALEAIDERLVPDEVFIDEVAANVAPPGRCQLVPGRPNWLVDVSHNAEAAERLAAAIRFYSVNVPVTLLLGMLSDKDVHRYVAVLEEDVDDWIACDLDTRRGMSLHDVASATESVTGKTCHRGGQIEAAMALAIEITPPDGLIVASGSFHIAGPVLEKINAFGKSH